MYKLAKIVEEDGKYKLYNSKKTKVLGTHDSYEKALRQERAIWASKLAGFAKMAKSSYSSEDKIPERYLKGLTKKEREKMKKEIMNQPDSYRDWDADKAYKERKKKKGEKPTKKSEATKAYHAKYGSSSSETALRNKAKKTDYSYSTLKKVYDRGLAAWKTGHRPGVSQHQWAMGRVNSFITGKGGARKADKDLTKESALGHRGTSLNKVAGSDLYIVPGKSHDVSKGFKADTMYHYKAQGKYGYPGALAKGGKSPRISKYIENKGDTGAYVSPDKVEDYIDAYKSDTKSHINLKSQEKVKNKDRGFLKKLLGLDKYKYETNKEKVEKILKDPKFKKEHQKVIKEMRKNKDTGFTLKVGSKTAENKTHELIFYKKRSTPEVIVKGDEPKAYDSYGPITKRRAATPEEEDFIATGKWLRVDEEGNKPSSDNYKKTKYRPQLVKTKEAGMKAKTTTIFNSDLLKKVIKAKKEKDMPAWAKQLKQDLKDGKKVDPKQYEYNYGPLPHLNKKAEAESKSQQRLMAMVHAYQHDNLDMSKLDQGLQRKIKAMAKSMTKEETKDYAQTKHKNLPEKKASILSTINRIAPKLTKKLDGRIQSQRQSFEAARDYAKSKGNMPKARRYDAKAYKVEQDLQTARAKRTPASQNDLRKKTKELSQKDKQIENLNKELEGLKNQSKAKNKFTTGQKALGAAALLTAGGAGYTLGDQNG